MPRLLSIVGHAPSLGTPQTRSVRLIAWGRVVLAAVALVAVWIDPELPRPHVALTHAVLVAYLAYAVVVAVVVGRSPAPPPWLPLATHAIDLLGAPVLMNLTEGPNSPFFLYFLFPLMAATLAPDALVRKTRRLLLESAPDARPAALPAWVLIAMALVAVATGLWLTVSLAGVTPDMTVADLPAAVLAAVLIIIQNALTLLFAPVVLRTVRARRGASESA